MAKSIIALLFIGVMVAACLGYERSLSDADEQKPLTGDEAPKNTPQVIQVQKRSVAENQQEFTENEGQENSRIKRAPVDITYCNRKTGVCKKV